MNAHDRDKMTALLKSVAQPCDNSPGHDDHCWTRCRHCLAIEELENNRVRKQLAAWIAEVEHVAEAAK